MDIIVIPFLLLLKGVVNLAVITVVADVILGWLIAANILNNNNVFVQAIIDTVYKFSSFMLDPIRRKMPISVGTLDISPVVFVLFMTFIDNIIDRILQKIV